MTDYSEITMASGEKLPLPRAYDPGEFTLVGNCKQACDHVVFAYCAQSETGLVWCRYPEPYWQMIQPITRDDFDAWAQNVYRNLQPQVAEGLRNEPQRE